MNTSMIPYSKYIISIFVMSIMPIISMGQNLDPTISYPHLDSLNYQYYLEKDWDNVLETGQLALDNEIDYSFLRLRMGDASIEKSRYNDAINHFDKALEFDEYNEYANSQKLLVLKLMGKNDRAHLFYKSVKQSIQKKLGDSNVLDFVNISGGYLVSPNLTDKRGLSIMGSDSLFGSQYLLGNQYFLQAGLKFHLLKNLNVYVGFNNINIQTRKEYQYAEYQGVTTNYQDWGFSRYPDTVADFNYQSKSSTIVQNEIYFNASLLLNNGFTVSAYANIMMVKTNLYNYSYNTRSRVDTAYYIYATGEKQMFTYGESDYQFYNSDTSFINFVAGARIEKDFGTVSLGLSASYSNLKNAHQTQIGLYALYYPFGTFNFYGISDFKYLANSYKHMELSNIDQNIIFTQSFGLRIIKSLWTNIGFSYGNITNSNINDAFIVYNITDGINYKLDLGFKFFIGKHLELNMIYQMFDKYRYYYSYEINSGYSIENSIAYKTHSIIGGLKWNF